MSSWKHTTISLRFLKHLYQIHGHRAYITNGAAYFYYCKYHHNRDRRNWKFGWRKPTRKDEQDNWLQMNVRNTLCAATKYGYLIRIRPGVYKFTTKPIPDTHVTPTRSAK